MRGCVFTMIFVTVLTIVGLVVAFAVMGSYKPKTVEDELFEVLVEGALGMRRHKIPYWLDHGTLLGFTRDGYIIPGDLDADSCIQKKDVERLMALKGYFATRGYDLERFDRGVEWRDGIPIGEDYCRLVSRANPKRHLDIALAIEREGFLFDPCVSAERTLRQTWATGTIFPLKKTKVRGETFSVPHDVDKVNFTAYNDDCYEVRKTQEKANSDAHAFNRHTEELYRTITGQSPEEGQTSSLS